MTYEAALQKAWGDLESAAGDRTLTLKFLAGGDYNPDAAGYGVHEPLISSKSASSMAPV